MRLRSFDRLHSAFRVGAQARLIVGRVVLTSAFITGVPGFAGTGAAEPPPAVTDRWIHPAFSALPLELPGTFDQQTVVTLGDGRLMTIHPKGNATVVSRDGGRTWSEPQAIRTEATPVVPTRGPLIRTRDGTLIFFFQVLSGLDTRWDEAKRDWTPSFRSDLWVMRSRDEGRTWDEPRRPYEGVYGTITSAIQTRSGHVVVPIQIALKEPGRWGTYVFVSADDGLTWTRSNVIDLGGNGHHDGAIEAAVTELSDARLLLLVRTSLDSFWEITSHDHGYTWREWRPSGLDAGSAPGFVKRLASGRLVVVWNRVNRESGPLSIRSAPSAAYYQGARGQRGELSIAHSDDDGRTWSPPVVMVRQSKTSLSYPFILERSPGEIWLWTRYGSSPPAYLKISERDLVERVKNGARE